MEYLAKKPECNPYVTLMGQCDYAIHNVGDRVYYKGRIDYTYIDHFTQVQGVPECVQKFIYIDYFNFIKRYNSASGLSAFLAILLAALFLLL